MSSGVPREHDLTAARLRGVIAVLRLDDGDLALRVAESLVAGGIGVLEITLTTPSGLAAISDTVKAVGDKAIVGAGSIRQASDLRAAIDAGAQFAVTPAVRPDVLALGARETVPVVCGAATPTEVLTAFELGAAVVKVFPVRELGGPEYIRALRAPLPDIPLMPTGGVALEHVGAYRAAGVVGVGIGGPLLPHALLEPFDGEGIAERARSFMSAWDAAA